MSELKSVSVGPSPRMTAPEFEPARVRLGWSVVDAAVEYNVMPRVIGFRVRSVRLPKAVARHIRFSRRSLLGLQPSAYDAMVHSPMDLQVSVRVDPSEPIGSVDQGYFETIVSAQNTSRDSVVVVLPKASDAGPPVAFRFDWSNEHGGVSYDDRAWDPEVTIFAPGEIKQRVFDLHIDDKNEVVAGTDSLRGGYASHWSVPVEVTVIK